MPGLTIRAIVTLTERQEWLAPGSLPDDVYVTAIDLHMLIGRMYAAE